MKPKKWQLEKNNLIFFPTHFPLNVNNEKNVKKRNITPIGTLHGLNILSLSLSLSLSQGNVFEPFVIINVQTLDISATHHPHPLPPLPPLPLPL